jgi:flagellar assembly factor FliW
MQVHTTRFGTVDIAEDRVITFPKGLLGFQQHRRFCLLQPNDDACFFWLQSVDDPTLAFVVTDPVQFFPDYSVPVRTEQMDELKLRNLDDSQVLVIVNKVGPTLTGNLQGPLVVNIVERVGEQFVLAEKKWTTRHDLLSLEKTARAATA